MTPKEQAALLREVAATKAAVAASPTARNHPEDAARLAAEAEAMLAGADALDGTVWRERNGDWHGLTAAGVPVCVWPLPSGQARWSVWGNTGAAPTLEAAKAAAEAAAAESE